MATYKLLATVTFVVCLLADSTAGLEGFESYEPIGLSWPFRFRPSEESTWNNFLASPHIAGGNEVVPHSYPHQVLLVIKGNKDGVGNGGLCSGSILTDEWVVTAAHCCDKRIIFLDADANEGEQFKLGILVAAGVHKPKEPISERVQVRNVSELFFHPDWYLFTMKNDIALLKVEKNFDINEYVRPIRLPKLSQQNESFKGSLVTMTGWGSSEKEKGTASTLNAVESEVIGNFYCKLRYLFLLVRDTNICISGSGGKGTCKGDSGGPLIIKEADGEPTLIGVTSFGIGCTWGFPSAFTRVTSYLSWLHNTTGTPLRP